MQESPAHVLLGRLARAPGAGQIAAEPGDVLVVLCKQQRPPCGGAEPTRRTRPRLQDGDARLVLAHHCPGHTLLVDRRRDDRRIVVHQVHKPSVMSGGHENVDRDDADQALPLDDCHVVRAVAADARHCSEDVHGHLLGTGHRDASGCVPARDAKAFRHGVATATRCTQSSVDRPCPMLARSRSSSIAVSMPRARTSRSGMARSSPFSPKKTRPP